MSKDEINDIKLIKAEIERMNGHISIFKGYGKTLDNIESALVGSSLNGHDGLVYKIEKLSKKVEDFDRVQSQFTLAKWIFGAIFIAVIGSIVRDKMEIKEKTKTETAR